MREHTMRFSMARAAYVLATSEAPIVRAARSMRRRVRRARLPVPVALLRPALWAFTAVRKVWNESLRFFLYEPLFRARCARVGRRFQIGYHLHWISGAGRIEIGDDVCIDGKCSFMFAHRFSDAPTLVIGDGTMIGHGSSFVVARRIEIGRHCLIASDVHVFESSGHPTDPAKRLAGQPPDPDDVKPIRILDNVWIGLGATIFPGVTIGEGSVVAARSVVTTNVPEYSLVAGYPARKLATLPSPAIVDLDPR